MTPSPLPPRCLGTWRLRATGREWTLQHKPRPTLEPPNWLEETLAPWLKATLPPVVAQHARVGGPSARGRPQLLRGGRKVGPREAWSGRNRQAGSWCGGRESGQRRGMAFHAELAILGDVQLGVGSLGTRSWQGLGQGPKGQGRARSPWWGVGGVHGLGHRYEASEPELPALHPAQPRARPKGRWGATSPIWPPS